MTKGEAMRYNHAQIALCALGLGLGLFGCDHKTLAKEQNSATLPSYTLTQVAAHASSTDCWMVIDDAVYDLTFFVNMHPRGKSSIVSNCGKDASQAFDNVGHSDSAISKRNALRIANIALSLFATEKGELSQ
jgi:cytochrome b involved in lipid metabolism